MTAIGCPKNRKQFSDYSRIVRTGNSTKPSKRLLIIFDNYEVADNSSGDFYLEMQLVL